MNFRFIKSKVAAPLSVVSACVWLEEASSDFHSTKFVISFETFDVICALAEGGRSHTQVPLWRCARAVCSFFAFENNCLWSKQRTSKGALWGLESLGIIREYPQVLNLSSVAVIKFIFYLYDTRPLAPKGSKHETISQAFSHCYTELEKCWVWSC